MKRCSRKRPARCFARLVGALAISLALALAAWAAQGDLLWTDRLDLAADFDSATAIDASEGQVYATGLVTNSTGDNNWLVRSYEARTGGLLWADQLDLAGGDDRALAVEAHRGRVFVAGNGTSGAGNRDWLVRAYEARTGALLWTDQVDVTSLSDVARDLDAAGNRVFVVGGGGDCPVPFAPGDCDFLVRAYDGQNGTLAWEDRLDLSGGSDRAEEVTAQGGFVFVGGGGGDCGDFGASNCDFLVRAYEAETGTLVWMDRADLAGGYDQVFDISASGGRVFAVGIGTNATGNFDWIVRAHDAGTGELLWEEQFGLAAGRDDARGVFAGKGRVFVAGFGWNASGNFDWLVRAYDGRTGELLWADQFDLAGGSDSAFGVLVQGRRVYVTGEGTNAAGSRDAVLRVHDAGTGALLWMDQFDQAGGVDTLNGVATQGDRIFAALASDNAAGNSDFMVRGYDAR